MLAVNYPIGQWWALTGQTKQQLVSTISKTVGGSIIRIEQRYQPSENSPDYTNGNFHLVFVTESDVELSVQQKIIAILVDHPGATITQQ